MSKLDWLKSKKDEEPKFTFNGYKNATTYSIQIIDSKRLVKFPPTTHDETTSLMEQFAFICDTYMDLILKNTFGYKILTVSMIGPKMRERYYVLFNKEKNATLKIELTWRMMNDVMISVKKNEAAYERQFIISGPMSMGYLYDYINDKLPVPTMQRRSRRNPFMFQTGRTNEKEEESEIFGRAWWKRKQRSPSPPPNDMAYLFGEDFPPRSSDRLENIIFRLDDD